MEKITFDDWNPADEIETKEDVLAYLEIALERNDSEFLLRTIGYIACSKGIGEIAHELKLNQESLYKSFSENENPSFIMVVKVLDKLGFKLNIQLKQAS